MALVRSGFHFHLLPSLSLSVGSPGAKRLLGYMLLYVAICYMLYALWLYVALYGLTIPLSPPSLTFPFRWFAWRQASSGATAFLRIYKNGQHAFFANQKSTKCCLELLKVLFGNLDYPIQVR